MIYNNVLEAMGNTPIIALNHMTEPDSARILVKFEGLNVGGSIKTRTAFNMLRSHIIALLVSSGLIALLPVYGKWLKSINTSIGVEDNGKLDEIDISGED